MNSSTLSPREQEVMQLLIKGLTNRQIAHALGISQRTVGVYVSRIYRKLGVNCRAAAVAVYLKKYLVEQKP